MNVADALRSLASPPRAHSKSSTLLLVMLLASFTNGCSPASDIALAQQQVPRFHAMFNQGRTLDLYLQGSEDLRALTSQEQFVGLLDAIRQGYGAVKSTEQATSEMNYRSDGDFSGAFVTLLHNTTFADGAAIETFVFRIEDDAALLAGYHFTAKPAAKRTDETL